MSAAVDKYRKAQLGLIHRAKADCALADDAYRAMLQGHCGVDSAAKLDAAGRQLIIDVFKKQYKWEPPAPKAGKRRREKSPSSPRASLWKKIDAQLYSLGLTRAYLDGEIKERLAGGITSWDFADEAILSKVIAALAYQQKRVGAKRHA